MASHLPSQKYLSTRGGSYGLTFEEAVLKGLAEDGGLFIPEEIPSLPANWFEAWKGLSFQELAFEVLSLYISPSEISPEDLKELINRSYATFRHPEVTPLHELLPEQHLYLLELFHGPTFAFKDVALQFVGNLFEYFLQRKNKSLKEGEPRHQLTVIGATSGDTGSAAIYGLRGKKDVSVFILHPKGRVSPIQEAQMTTVLDSNVHNVAVEGTFDDCQDIVKALFSDPVYNKTRNLAAVNSINWARILAQIVYYFHSYFNIARQYPSAGKVPDIHYIVPTGNFGDILAGYFAKRMGLPITKLHISTNANDILDRFVKHGIYEKHDSTTTVDEDGVKADTSGVKETFSPAMDILVSSNFERLLWYLALEAEANNTDKAAAGAIVKGWMDSLKATGRTQVSPEVLETCRRDFGSQRVSNEQTIHTIKSIFTNPTTKSYILDPHSAVGVAGALRVIAEEGAKNNGVLEHTKFIALSTAHPAKFSYAVDLALNEIEGYGFEELVRPKEFIGLEQREKRVRNLDRADKELVKALVEEELAAEHAA